MSDAYNQMTIGIGGSDSCDLREPCDELAANRTRPDQNKCAEPSLLSACHGYTGIAVRRRRKRTVMLVHTSPEGDWEGPKWPLETSEARLRFMRWLARAAAAAPAEHMEL